MPIEALAAAALFFVVVFSGKSYAVAPALPDPVEILRNSLSPPRVPYSGEVSVITWFGKKTRAKELLVSYAPPRRFRREIVNQSGYTAQVIVSDGKTEWVFDRGRRTAWKVEAADADYKILGPDEEFDLLTENYRPRVIGEENVAGRPCWLILILSLKDDRPVRRLWLDKEHGLILQAKSYQPDGSLVSTMRYVNVDLPAELEESSFQFKPPAGTKIVRSRLKPGYMELEDARAVSGMDPHPPSWLPLGYVFESLNVLPYKGASLLHFRYSDGIDALSVFQCPASVRLDAGELPRDRMPLNSGKADLSFGPEGKILDWPHHGHRFVIVGNLPLDTLRKIADSVQ